MNFAGLEFGTSGGPVLKFPGRSVIGYLKFRSVGSVIGNNRKITAVISGYFQFFRSVGSRLFFSHTGRSVI